MEMTGHFKGFLKIHILKLISEKPSSGYGLMNSIEEISGRRPSAGSIYPLLKDLEKRGLIEAQHKNKKTYAKSFIIQYNNTDSILAKPLVEKYDDIYVIQNPPMRPLTRLEMDEVYNLPFMREPHPLLEKQGHIYAMDEVKFSIVANRGCFGGCSFCALTTHQGRVIQSRSKESIVKEAKQIISSKDFKGYIHDVGGPTANFYQIACQKQVKYGVCVNKACIGYKPCSNLEVSHKEYLDVLRTLRKLDNVKKVFIRSGIRYDYLMYDKNRIGYLFFCSNSCMVSISALTLSTGSALYVEALKPPTER